MKIPVPVSYKVATLLFVLTAGLGVRASEARPAPPNTVVLPIEVAGPDGYVESVVLNVPDPAGVDSMFIQCHSCGYQKSAYADQVGYDKKASFRVNGGSWINIDNATARVYFPERVYEGIGGPYHTIRMKLPVSGIVAGANTVEFRFNRTEGVGTGYRILKLDLHRQSGASAISGTTFVEDNPDTWQAPLNTAADIAAGQRLWTQRNLLKSSPLGDAIPFIAACSDCHAKDGRDLKFFNFSNKSIITRSKFHGLTDVQAQQIASFIRSVDLELPSGVTVKQAGRPWNPPYQPGPGLDAKPAELWAAGAGLQWVLDQDEQTLPYLFPNGASGKAGLAVAHPDSTLNVREIPVAIQLPDWNNWLPDIHPLDFMTAGTFEASPIYRDLENTVFNELSTKRQALIDASRQGGGLRHLFKEYGNTLLTVDFPAHVVKAPWSASGEKLDDLSYQQWILIRMWEAMHKFKLEDLGDYVFNDNPAQPDWKGSRRTWVPRNSPFFNLAPHKNSRPEYPDAVSPYPTRNQNVYFSTAWYELQMIVNSGNQASTDDTPMDWNYHQPHIMDTGMRYGLRQPLRHLKAQIVVMQERSNSRGLESRQGGWYYHMIMPERVTGNSPNLYDIFRGFDPVLHRDIAETLMRAWLTHTLRFDVSLIPRITPDPQDIHIPLLTYIPTGTNRENKAESHFRLVRDLYKLGVSPGVVDSVAAWGEAVWPLGNWEQFMQSGSRQRISLPQGWSMISSRVMPSQAGMQQVLAGILPQVTLVKDQSGNTFWPSQNVNTIGNWDTGESYMIYTTAPVSLELVGTPLSPENTPVALEAGWNFAPYTRNGAMSPEAAFAPILENIRLVKDSYGRSFVPEWGINQIGFLEPGQGYKVYTQAAGTFNYPANSASLPALKAQSSAVAAAGPRISASATLLVEAPDLENGDAVLVRQAGGKVIGEALVENGRAVLTLLGDEALTANVVEGARDGDELTMEVRRAGEETAKPLAGVSLHDGLADAPVEGALRYKNDGFFIARSTASADQFSLEQNFPNPAADQTRIAYSLAEAVHVRLEVYDALGRFVSLLVDEEQSPGRYTVDAETASLASGVYFYRIEAGSFNEVRKMMVVR